LQSEKKSLATVIEKNLNCEKEQQGKQFCNGSNKQQSDAMSQERMHPRKGQNAEMVVTNETCDRQG